MEDPEKETLEENLQEPAVEVNLAEKKEEAPKEEEKKIDPAEARRKAYETRRLDQINREVQEIKRYIQPREPVSDGEFQDPIDRVAYKDWKQGVKLVAKQLLEEEKERLRQEEASYSKVRELETSRQKVRERYPMIDDESAPETRLFIQIQNENQSLLSNPRGPELVMHLMEERMRANGRMTPDIRPAVEKEINRRARVGVGQLPQGRTTKSDTYTLTKEQKQYCDHHKIPYDKYATMARALDQGEGIEG